MNSRVGRVALKLRLDDSDRERADELRRAVERVLLQQALDELERRVHDRLGSSAIVRARTLSLRWSLDADVIDDSTSAWQMGRDLAAALLATIDALPKPQRLRPDSQCDIVVLADEDHAVAAYLADAAEGRTAWFHAPHTSAARAWTSVVQGGPSRVEAVTRWLERMECSERVLRWLTDVAGAPPARPPAPRDLTQSSALPSEPLLPALQGVREAPPGHPAMAAQLAAVAVPGVFADAAPARDRPLVAVTQIAGLWYLARLVLELELAEHLWQVGVREGDFLAHVVAAVAGSERVDDPAWRWFGGAFDREPVLDAVAEWADDELATKLAAALVRLSLGAAPTLVPIRCATEAPDARTATVVSRYAAALVQVFCARLGIEPDVERLRTLLRVPGRLELGDPLRVTIAMDCIDIDVRRAGLDFDPGYLPWLARKVVIEFEASP